MVYKATVRLSLSSGVTIQGTVNGHCKTPKDFFDVCCDYFLEEVWHDGSTIDDIEVSSIQPADSFSKLIAPGTTLDDDQAKHGHDYTPFHRYKILENI